MKKLIAFLVVSMFLVTGAFAADIGATAFGYVDLIKGSSSDADDEIRGGGAWGRARLSGSAQNDDGTFGGSVRFNAGGWGVTPSAWGWAWWKPLDMLKFQVGINPDGEFGLDGLAGWGFHAGAPDAGQATSANQNLWGDGYTDGVFLRNAFYGGYTSNGMIVSLTPLDLLEINVGVPIIAMAGEKAGDIYGSSHIQAKLNLAGIGTFGATFAGDANGNNGLFVFAGLNLIDALGIDIGFGYHMEDDNGGQPPMAIGVGAQFDAGAFGVKARGHFEFGSNSKWTGTVKDGDSAMYFEVMPFFGLNNSLRIFVPFGIGMHMPDKGDNATAWHLAPYLQYNATSWGTLFAGVRLESPMATKDSFINWAVPIGIVVNF